MDLLHHARIPWLWSKRNLPTPNQLAGFKEYCPLVPRKENLCYKWELSQSQSEWSTIFSATYFAITTCSERASVLVSTGKRWTAGNIPSESVYQRKCNLFPSDSKFIFFIVSTPNSYLNSFLKFLLHETVNLNICMSFMLKCQMSYLYSPNLSWIKYMVFDSNERSYWL